jgi:hypothetical protein
MAMACMNQKEVCDMVSQDKACMVNPESTSKLSALVRLLEDASPVVREAVTLEFASYGPGLSEDLRRLEGQPNDADWKLLAKITAHHYRRRLRLAWPHWMNIPDDRARLERALTLLAEFQNGPRWRPPLGDLLDRLAGEYLDREGAKSPEALAGFLFREKGMQGVENGRFLPDHSNLAHVIESGRGLPVSLVCIYLLVGARTGLEIHACNWPRHFLARYRDESGLFIVDPANGGAVVDAETFLSMQGTSREAAEAVISFEVDSAAIITRILGNLARAYRAENDEDNCLLAVDLLRNIESRMHADALC